MKSTPYQKYTEDELIEVYTSMKEYSGVINDELQSEIQLRGGLELFLKKIDRKNSLEKEMNEIRNKVYELCRDQISINIIKNNIHSTILSESQLVELIESSYERYHSHAYDRKISNQVIIRCILGGLLATIAGSILWGYSIYYFKEMNFLVLSFLSVFIYLTVQVIVRRSTNNLALFITAFISIIASFFGGFYFLSLLPF